MSSFSFAVSGDGTLARAGAHGLVAGGTALFADDQAEPALLLTPRAQRLLRAVVQSGDPTA